MNEYEQLQLRMLTEELFGQQVEEAQQQPCQPRGVKAELGMREFAAWPSVFDRTAYSRASLRDALAATSSLPMQSFLARHPGPTIRPLQDGYQYRYEQGIDHQRQDCVYWQIRRSGLMYQSAVMGEDINEERMMPRLSPASSLRYVANATTSAGRYYEQLQVGDREIVIRIRFCATQDRQLEVDPAFNNPGVTCHLPEIRSEICAQASRLSSDPGDFTLELVFDLLEQCGWVDAPRDSVSRLVAHFQAEAERSLG